MRAASPPEARTKRVERGIAGESAECAFGERDAAGGKRAVNLAGGELNLRHGGIAAERSGARLGAKAGGAQRDGKEQPAMHAIACYQNGAAAAWHFGTLDLVLMGHTAEFVVRHGYALLFVWLLAEQGALPLPSIPLLLACGALSRSGQLNPVLVVLSGMAACLIADNVWFQLGRLRGARILQFSVPHRPGAGFLRSQDGKCVSKIWRALAAGVRSSFRD